MRNGILRWDGEVVGGIRTVKEIQKLEGGSSVCTVAFSPDSKLLASVLADTTIKLSDTTAVAQGRLKRHAKQVNDIASSADGKAVAPGSTSQTVTLWDVATGRATRKLQGHHGSIFAIAFSPDDTIVASGSGDNIVIFGNVGTGEQR